MGLKVWLPLNGTLDNYGCGQSTIENHNATVNTAGKIGSCYNFNGSNNWISGTYEITPNITFAAWVYFNSSVPNGKHIFDARTSSGTGYQPMYITTTSIQTGNSANGYPSYSYTWTANTWYHICITHSSTSCTCYVNGIQIGTGTSGKGMTGSTCNFTLASRCNQSNYANIKMNDIRIYDHCLSAAEVHEIAQGLVLHYKLDNLSSTTSTIIDSTINDTAYNSSLGKYGYNSTSNLAKTSGVFQGKQCIKISTITAGQTAQPYAYFSNLFTSNGTNQPAYKILEFDYYTTCPTTTWLNIYKLGNGTGTATWTTISSVGVRSGIYTNSSNSILVQPNEWNHVKVILHGNTDANAEWGYCVNGPAHTSNANYYFLYANISVIASANMNIEDNSGYNHHGTTIGEIEQLTNSGGRYLNQTKWNCSAPTENSETGICYIQTSFTLTTPLQMSITWWAKPENGYGSSTSHAAFCTSNNTSRPTDYNSTAFHHRDAGFDIYPSDGSGVKRLTFNQYTANEWHHYAIIYDGTTAYAYRDGVQTATVTVGTNKTLATFTQLFIGYSQAGGVKRKTLGSYSDFRIYCTALNADDVLQLYHTSAKIDNKANFHTFEFNEFNTNKLTKTGIMNDNIEESIMTLPDGSCWQLLLFHYVDNGNNLFTSTNATNCNEFGLFSRLKDIDNFKYNNQYEFYVIQDDVAHRWVQTNAPLTTSSVAGFSAVSGSPAGGICKCNGNTVLAATSTTSNWWRACGCWTKYNGGIPGFNGAVCLRYLALYARIDKADVKISNQTLNTSNLIEL